MNVNAPDKRKSRLQFAWDQWPDHCRRAHGARRSARLRIGNPRSLQKEWLMPEVRSIAEFGLAWPTAKSTFTPKHRNAGATAIHENN